MRTMISVPLLLLCIFALVPATTCSVAGRELNSWKFYNDHFEISVIARTEVGIIPILPGSYIEFRSRKLGGVHWNPVMTVRQDDVAVELTPSQVRFVSADVAYVYMGNMYAVTVDGGETWSLWDAATVRQEHERREATVILSVQIEPDGTGEMSVIEYSKKPEVITRMHTDDYGKNWWRRGRPSSPGSH